MFERAFILSRNNQAIVIACAITLIPWIAAGFPSLGLMIGRSKRRHQFVLAAIGVGILGLMLKALGLLEWKASLALFAPLYQVLLLSLAYHLWFKLFDEKPKSVYMNFNSGLAHHRFLAISIVFLGVIPWLFVIAP